MTYRWYVKEDGGVRSLHDGSFVYYDPPPNNAPVDHGYELSDANTGLLYNGVSEGDLETRPGGTFSTDGEIIEGYKFTGKVNLAAEGQIVRNCLATPQGSFAIAFEALAGSVGATFEGITIRPPVGTSAYVGILDNGFQTIIRRPRISRCENGITTVAEEFHYIEPFIDEPSAASNPGGHRDLIEVYGGSGLIERARLDHDAEETAPINVAPWGGAEVHGLRVTKCWIDGGNYHTLVDGQPVGGATALEIVTDVQYDGNWFGGHTNPWVGRYAALLNSDAGLGRTVVNGLMDQNEDPSAILWVIDDRDGLEPNMWMHCDGLTPDRSNTVASDYAP